MNNEYKPLDAIQITIMYVRAMGPVSRDGIVRELLTQCIGVNDRKMAESEADRAIRHGLSTGWMEEDGEDYYDMAR